MSAELPLLSLHPYAFVCEKDAKNKVVEDVLILSGDHLYRMDYMDFVQVTQPFLTASS